MDTPSNYISFYKILLKFPGTICTLKSYIDHYIHIDIYVGVDNKTKSLQNNQSQVQLDKINPLSYVHKTKHTYIHRKQIHIYIYCFSP